MTNELIHTLQEQLPATDSLCRMLHVLAQLRTIDPAALHIVVGQRDYSDRLVRQVLQLEYDLSQLTALALEERGLLDLSRLDFGHSKSERH